MTKKKPQKKNPRSVWKSVAKSMSLRNPRALEKLLYSVMKEAPATQVMWVYFSLDELVKLLSANSTDKWGSTEYSLVFCLREKWTGS